MASVCGSVVSVTLGGRLFSVAADADSQRDLGGWNNTIMLNGDGTARMQKLRVPWKIGGLQIAIDDSKGDQEFINLQKSLFDYFPIAITFTDNTVYQGSGQITSETPTSGQNATMAIELSGPGELTKQ